MTPEEETAALLPCTYIPIGCQEVADRNAWCLNCRQRPAVAARLRERDKKIAELERVLEGGSGWAFEEQLGKALERIAELEATIAEVEEWLPVEKWRKREADYKAENKRLRARIQSLEPMQRWQGEKARLTEENKWLSAQVASFLDDPTVKNSAVAKSVRATLAERAK